MANTLCLIALDLDNADGEIREGAPHGSNIDISFFPTPRALGASTLHRPRWHKSADGAVCHCLSLLVDDVSLWSPRLQCGRRVYQNRGEAASALPLL